MRRPYTYTCDARVGKCMNAVSVCGCTCSLFALELLPGHRRQKGAQSGKVAESLWSPTLSRTSLILTDRKCTVCAIYFTLYFLKFETEFLLQFIDMLFYTLEKKIATLMCFFSLTVANCNYYINVLLMKS